MRPFPVSWSVVLLGGLLVTGHGVPVTAQQQRGLRGDPAAIAEAAAMVEAMGGQAIWSHVKALHFVHEWFFRSRVDSYVENEILDLTGPRSWIEMRSEIYHRLRAYSPAHGYWNVINGTFSRGTAEEVDTLMQRAPFHFVRILRGIAVGDPFYEVRFGRSELGGAPQLEFYGPDGQRGGWMVLNVRKEPIVWGVPQFQYIFGPLRRYGNLRMPGWAVTGNGAVSYEMIGLTGDYLVPDSTLFVPPPDTLASLASGPSRTGLESLARGR